MSDISAEQELEIVDLFLHSKMSLTSIAEKFGRKHAGFVYAILEKHGVHKKRRHIRNNIDACDISDIIDFYQEQNMPIRQIAKKYRASNNTIKKILLNNNIEIRKHYRHTFDENYFDNIDNANKAYLLGFLYADGCVNKNNVVSFTIHQDDKEILEMYVKELQATNPITSVKGKPHVRISFCSKHMCDTLKTIGCGQNKTDTLNFPCIDKKYQYDFIRGFMDGDGCICIYNRGKHKYIDLSFTGTLEMMRALKSIFSVDNEIKFYRGAYNIHIGKSEDVLRILKNIYLNAELYMSRKRNKYEEYISWIESR